MTHHLIDSDFISCDRLANWARGKHHFAFAPAALQRLERDRQVVEKHLAAGAPVYGLNTGLGGNLGFRLSDGDLLAFQEQLILGRMIGMGEPLPMEVVRAAQLARVIGFARGGTGVSVGAAQAVMALLDHGITPVVPTLGSISAGTWGCVRIWRHPSSGTVRRFFKGGVTPVVMP